MAVKLNLLQICSFSKTTSSVVPIDLPIWTSPQGHPCTLFPPPLRLPAGIQHCPLQDIFLDLLQGLLTLPLAIFLAPSIVFPLGLYQANFPPFWSSSSGTVPYHSDVFLDSLQHLSTPLQGVLPSLPTVFPPPLVVFPHTVVFPG
ncbi:hypothetical protein DL96DRAFT_1718233 [Flagelloscypha sp. PMI_526]|nr:hypothetical protein DL96DRAFT_1718233 [Flagelloscypha sp. PMI_526]